MSDADTLFSEFEMNAFILPKWFERLGLSRYRPIIWSLRASWKHWAATDADGLTNLSPMVVVFNAPPREIKKLVGGHAWRKIHTASLRTNTSRMVLMLLGQWTLEEALEWPIHERRSAKNVVEHNEKSTLLIACRHTQKGERLMDHLMIARDFRRMGGTIDPAWGRKRLRREHDALTLSRAMKSADATPWAKPWHADIDGYTFRLLKSEVELAFEGASQKHCCRSYAQACRAGTETVFSVMGPERATMSWNSRHNYLQVKAFANQGVTDETARAARKCIDRYFEDLAASKVTTTPV